MFSSWASIFTSQLIRSVQLTGRHSFTAVPLFHPQHLSLQYAQIGLTWPDGCSFHVTLPLKLYRVPPVPREETGVLRHELYDLFIQEIRHAPVLPVTYATSRGLNDGLRAHGAVLG